MEDLTQKVLETIREEKIRPKPRWEFLLKNYAIWAVAFISLIIGGLAMSVVIYMSINNSWDLYEYANNSLLVFAVKTLPYFWIISLIFLVLVADYTFKHTKKGYKHTLFTIVLASILLSILLGVFFYNIGIGQAIDGIFDKKVSFYGKIMKHRMTLWNHPEKGMLVGEITHVESNNVFTIKDVKGNMWDISCCDERFLEELLKIEKGMRIQAMGERGEDNYFEAVWVKPFGVPIKMMNEEHLKVMKEIMKERPPVMRMNR